jgi:hypothetical protein
MRHELSRIVTMVAVVVGMYLLVFLLIYFIPLDAIDFETIATVVTVFSICMSALAVVIDRRSPTPASHWAITITIEDSSGARARTVTHSDRSIDELKRLLDRIVTQPS